MATSMDLLALGHARLLSGRAPHFMLVPCPKTLLQMRANSNPFQRCSALIAAPVDAGTASLQEVGSCWSCETLKVGLLVRQERAIFLQSRNSPAKTTQGTPIASTSAILPSAHVSPSLSKKHAFGIVPISPWSPSFQVRRHKRPMERV